MPATLSQQGSQCNTSMTRPFAINAPKRTYVDVVLLIAFGVPSALPKRDSRTATFVISAVKLNGRFGTYCGDDPYADARHSDPQLTIRIPNTEVLPEAFAAHGWAPALHVDPTQT